jgi:hypothetical protein
MIRKLLRNKKLVGGLGPAVLTSIVGEVIYHYRARRTGRSSASTSRRANSGGPDLSSDVNDALRGAKRWLRDNHASDRMKEVLDQWLAEESYRPSDVIDVPAKSRGHSRSKSPSE